MENLSERDLPAWMVTLFKDDGADRAYIDTDDQVTLNKRAVVKWMVTTNLDSLPDFSGRSFVMKLKNDSIKWMTDGRVRAVLNILKDSYFGVRHQKSGKWTPKATIGQPQPAWNPPAVQTATSSPSAVSSYVPKGYDFTDLPDGRFAIEDEGEWKFYWIKTLKGNMYIKGRFQWTIKPFQWGFWLKSNDRTFRRLRGETKELVGIQTAGDPSFRGEEEETIGQILHNPVQARTDYGKQSGRCGYCGRKLTDQESVSRGIGPDCWEDKHIPYISHLLAQGINPSTGQPL